MIIVKLIGGLGNQLFQYAAARKISYINGLPLKIDISPFSTYKLHKYGLRPFNIIEEIATPDDLAKVKCTKGIVGALRRLATNYYPYYRRPIVREQFFHFDPNILKVSGNVYLDGYWQSEKYFRDIEEIIRKDFAITTPQTGRNKELAEKIEATKSVSLHIRRGDYISNPKAMLFHGVCGMDHYKKCISIIGRKIEKPYFFIFSDDSQWVHDNFKIDYPMIIVDNNTDCAYEDLRLMSQCKHHIIANSSFSWWGAWLNPRQDKIVLAPKNWFNRNKVNDKDLMPVEWLRI